MLLPSVNVFLREYVHFVGSDPLIPPDNQYAEEQCLALSSFKRCTPQSGVSQELKKSIKQSR